MEVAGCDGEKQRHAKRIMTDMGDVDIPASIEYLEAHGGYCDCEILMNGEGWKESYDEEEWAGRWRVWEAAGATVKEVGPVPDSDEDRLAQSAYWYRLIRLHNSRLKGLTNDDIRKILNAEA